MNPSRSDRTAYSGFLRNVEERPGHEALRVGGRSCTYLELFEEAGSIAATLLAHDQGESELTGVLARRSMTTYAGILGVLLRGHGYVSLNPKHPSERVRSMMVRSELSAVVVDESGEKLLENLVSDGRRRWVLPHREDVTDLEERWPDQVWVGRRGMLPASDWERQDTVPEDIAYVLFTSGSTGDPKGVVVEQRNVTAFVDAILSRWTPSWQDRFSQLPEVSFDGSVFDLFVSWEVGATLCVPGDLDLLKPHEFILREQLTVWTFVPSIAGLMLRLNLLQPGSFPLLRASVFGGEVLPQAVAEAWCKAAPNSFLENHYGPTEATVSSSIYRWEEGSETDCMDGTVPIGRIMPGMDYLVIDVEGNEVPPGSSGELWLAGPQVSRGYWRDPERTARAFPVPPGSDVRHYRTGDRVIRPVDGGLIHFLGRLDDQIQIRGHRVELGEIEGVLREATGDAMVVALGWPEPVVGTADGIVGYVQAREEDCDLPAIRSSVEGRLPEYMCPRRYIFMERLPINQNGKVDRLRLKALLEEEESSSGNGT